MKKIVVLGTNDNPDFLKYLPYVQTAWNYLGWKTLTYYRGDEKLMPSSYDLNRAVPLNHVSSYRTETLVQVVRLLGWIDCDPQDMVMTSDVDMIPMCNYWKPKPEHITCYGHDLTGFAHYPMCYIAMTADQWSKVVVDINLESLLDKYPQAKSDVHDVWWSTDQTIITDKLKGCKIRSVHRGSDLSVHGLPAGRIDRYDWFATKNIPLPIDAHMPRPFDEQAVRFVMHRLFRETLITPDALER